MDRNTEKGHLPGVNVDAWAGVDVDSQVLCVRARARVRVRVRACLCLCLVSTKMTNLGMRKALGELGLTFIEADVGDRHVMDELINNDAILGGEGSGHIICLNKSTSGRQSQVNKV